MALIVQKYGGTSVGNPERILNVARRLIQTQTEGHQVVAVVSAMGDTTAAQIWYDKEHLYPVRVIQPAGEGHPRVEFRMLRYQFLSGGWIENEIRIFVDGRLVTTECYGEVRPHPGLSEDLFAPDAFATRRWAETVYPEVDGPPDCSSIAP